MRIYATIIRIKYHIQGFNFMERRLHTRSPFHLDIKVTDIISNEWHCIAKDFSVSGLYLSWEEAKIVPTLDTFSIGDIITLEFCIDNKEAFTLSAKVVRVVFNGMGVAFYIPAIAALEAYQYTTQQRKRSNIPLSTHAQNILKTIKSLVLQNMNELLNNFVNSVQENLFEMANNAPSDTDLRAYFDTISILNEKEEKFKKIFIENIKRTLRSLTEDISVTEDKHINELNQLSLIDKQEFENWLAESNIVHNTNQYYREVLPALEARFSYLLNLEYIEDKNNPVSPEQICTTLNYALIPLKLNHPSILLIYHIFESILKEQLHILYEQLNELFITHKIVPDFDLQAYLKIKEKESKNTSSSIKKEEQKENSIETETDKNTPPLTSSPTIMSAATEHEQQISTKPVPIQEKTNTSLTTQLITTNSNTSETNNTQNLFSPYQTIQALRGQQQYNINNIENILKEENFDIAIFYTLIDHLTQLQQKELNSNENFEDKITQLLSSENLPQELIDEIHNAVQLLEDLFATFMNDKNIDTEVLPLLEKLKIPVLKLILLDYDFFQSRLNPGRQVVNKITQLKIKNDKNTKNQLQFLIDHILQNFHKKTSVFTVILQQINTLIDKQEENIKNKLENKISEIEAKQYVSQQLASRLSNKPIEKIILQFIDKCWKDILLQIYLREGTQTLVWNQYIQVIELLAINKDQENYEEVVDFDILLHVINKALTPTTKNLSIIAELQNFLHGYTHNQTLITLSDYQIIAAISRNTPLIDAENIEKENDPDNKKLSLWIKRAKQLQINQWINFYQGDSVLYLKLVWLGSINQYYLFVNESLEYSLELDYQSLARRMQQGQIVLANENKLPLIERSFYNMLSNIHDNIREQVTHDSLTQLLTRKEFERLFKEQLEYLSNNTQHIFAWCNLDNFNMINNICSYSAGDEYLQNLVKIIQSIFSDNSVLISRLGNDEFGILFTNATTSNSMKLLEILRKKVNDYQFSCNKKHFTITLSIGVIAVTLEDEVNTLFQMANGACNTAKELGGNAIHFSDDNDLSRLHKLEIIEWASRIDDMLNNKQLDLRCQRIHPLYEGALSHYEILLVVKDSEGNPVSPVNFIEAAELYQRMSDIDKWVVQTCFQWIKKNPQLLKQMGGVSINLSAHSVSRSSFLNFLLEQLSTLTVDPHYICFEITETAAIAHLSNAIFFIQEIKQFGCMFSLDDFGTGLSSYSYLKNLPVDFLKIDGCFIKDIADNLSDQAMVKSIHEIGNFMGKKSIAEYVENNQILEFLQTVGIDYVQGFGIDKPKLLNEMTQLDLYRWQKLNQQNNIAIVD